MIFTLVFDNKYNKQNIAQILKLIQNNKKFKKSLIVFNLKLRTEFFNVNFVTDKHVKQKLRCVFDVKLSFAMIAQI